jgi:hypothetical protein
MIRVEKWSVSGFEHERQVRWIALRERREYFSRQVAVVDLLRRRIEESLNEGNHLHIEHYRGLESQFNSERRYAQFLDSRVREAEEQLHETDQKLRQAKRRLEILEDVFEKREKLQALALERKAFSDQDDLWNMRRA